MTIKISDKILPLLIIWLVFFSLISCENDRSIFWTIANADKIVDNSLNNNISVLSMTEYGTNYYISAGGSIWMQTTALSDDTWQKVNLPGKDDFCSSLVSFNAALYGSFIKSNGDGVIYSTTDTDSSPIWSEDTNYTSDKHIVKLLVAGPGPVLFVSLREPRPSEDDPYLYSLYYLNGVSYDPTSLVNESAPALDISYDGSDYLVISGSHVYQLSGSPTGSVTDINITSSDPDFGGILYSTGGIYYVSSEAGQIYRSTDAISWSNLSSAEEVSGKTVAFTDFIEVNNNILVGTQGYGFYQMTDGQLSSLERAGDNNNTDDIPVELYYSYILSFYNSATSTDLVFFCTAGDGLFHNTYNGTEWEETGASEDESPWVHE